MLNANLLKSKMVIAGDENFVQCLADLLNCSRTTASGKLGGTVPFTDVEIRVIVRKYKLTADDIKNIFVGDE